LRGTGFDRSTRRKKRVAAALSRRFCTSTSSGAMLLDRTPQQIRLAAQFHEHLVKVPGAARLPPHRLRAPGESRAELVAPAADRLVRDHDATLKQQRLNVAQGQAEPEIPASRAADDDSREAVAVIKRFRLLHRLILPPPVHQPDSALMNRQAGLNGCEPPNGPLASRTTILVV
jgi:hypothetical protein